MSPDQIEAARVCRIVAQSEGDRLVAEMAATLLAGTRARTELSDAEIYFHLISSAVDDAEEICREIRRRREGREE